jgi:hypothetical protein
MDNADYEEDYPAVDFKAVVAEIEAHKASELVRCEQSPSSGYVTFTFYQEDHCRGKMTFDELSEDTAFRVGAVLDFLSSATHTVIDQVEIERVWEEADPDAVMTRKL